MSVNAEPSPDDRRVRVVVDLPAAWLPAIEQARGDDPRGAWLRDLVWRALSLAGLTAGLRPWRTLSGRYDRLVRGAHVTDAWRRRERARRRRREYERRWRAGEAGRAKVRRDTQRDRERRAADRAARAGLDVVWTFTADGQALASDLAGLGVAGGAVDAFGRFTQTSRYTAGQVRAALLRAMQAEPAAAWPRCWRLFAEG